MAYNNIIEPILLMLLQLQEKNAFLQSKIKKIKNELAGL